MSYSTDMTELLEQAFAQTSLLSPREQNVIAGWLLKELESEGQWDESFANSQDALSELASKALAEHRQGKTQSLDPEKL